MIGCADSRDCRFYLSAGFVNVHHDSLQNFYHQTLQTQLLHEGILSPHDIR